MKYETLSTHHVDYGRNKFLELTIKKIVPDNSKFVNIAKGYYTPSGDRRYQRGIGFPFEEELISQLIDKLDEIKKESEDED
ncbi:MAG: hypothetical protein ABH950_01750 [Candidatus Altiarchaeota archaeon]